MVVDDHPAMREGLGMWINRQADMEFCGDAADVLTALKRIRESPPDVLVLDLALKDSDGIDLLKQLHTTNSSVAVLVCSMHPEIPYAERTMNNGARGFIGKHCEIDEIIEAIRTVARGEYYTSKAVSDRLMSKVFGGSSKRRMASSMETLSDRELQVFQHIGEGLTIAEISNRLHLSTHTVETYRQRMKAKLGVKTNTELACKATKWMMELHGETRPSRNQNDGD